MTEGYGRKERKGKKREKGKGKRKRKGKGKITSRREKNIIGCS